MKFYSILRDGDLTMWSDAEKRLYRANLHPRGKGATLYTSTRQARSRLQSEMRGENNAWAKAERDSTFIVSLHTEVRP